MNGIGDPLSFEERRLTISDPKRKNEIEALIKCLFQENLIIFQCISTYMWISFTPIGSPLIDLSIGKASAFDYRCKVFEAKKVTNPPVSSEATLQIELRKIVEQRLIDLSIGKASAFVPKNYRCKVFEAKKVTNPPVSSEATLQIELRKIVEQRLKEAYQKKAAEWHPNKNLTHPHAHERFMLLNEAYRLLYLKMNQPQVLFAFRSKEVPKVMVNAATNLFRICIQREDNSENSSSLFQMWKFFLAELNSMEKRLVHAHNKYKLGHLLLFRFARELMNYHDFLQTFHTVQAEIDENFHLPNKIENIIEKLKSLIERFDCNNNRRFWLPSVNVFFQEVNFLIVDCVLALERVLAESSSSDLVATRVICSRATGFGNSRLAITASCVMANKNNPYYLAQDFQALLATVPSLRQPSSSSSSSASTPLQLLEVNIKKQFDFFSSL